MFRRSGLRKVTLPDAVRGKLYLAGMPGRVEPLEEALAAIAAADITTVVCLVTGAEIHRNSPAYAELLARGDQPWEHITFPIQNFGVPDDQQAFLALAEDLAERLRGGKNILIHCAFGIGRTGTLAIAVLLCLGMSRTAARQTVNEVGSGPESTFQDRLLAWVEGHTPRGT